MSKVQGHGKCPQCRFEKADTEFNCRTNEKMLQCRNCGHCASWDAEWDNDHKLVGFTHTVTQGAGVLSYRHKGDCAYAAYFLSTQEEVTDAEKWLLERLNSGEVYPTSAYLSRWNPDTKAVEFVVGKLFEPGRDDAEDEIPTRSGQYGR